MHKITRREIVQRGCSYCTEWQIRQYCGRRQKVCLHDECPYRELDEYPSYRAYLKATPVANIVTLLGLKEKNR